jgi:hypothetical protein
MDQALEDREARLTQDYETGKWRQVRFAMALSRLSPSSAYAGAVMELAGTGVYRHDRFLRFLDEYRVAFRSYFDDLESRNVQSVKSFADVPEFSFREEPSRSVFARTIWDVGLITGMSITLFAAAYFSFVRYDRI